jgi:hypothetical protein
MFLASVVYHLDAPTNIMQAGFSFQVVSSTQHHVTFDVVRNREIAAAQAFL